MQPLEFEIDYIIPGDPVSLKRHRTVRKGNFTRNYDPSEGDKADFLVMSLQHRPKQLFTEALYVRMTFYFSRPKAHYGTGKNAGVLKDSAPIYHTGTPDVDNLIKFVGDSLNGKFWKDDAIISQLTATKLYGEIPQVHIQIVRQSQII